MDKNPKFNYVRLRLLSNSLTFVWAPVEKAGGSKTGVAVDFDLRTWGKLLEGGQGLLGTVGVPGHGARHGVQHQVVMKRLNNTFHEMC